MEGIIINNLCLWSKSLWGDSTKGASKD